MLEYLIDNIYVEFSWRIFQQKSAYRWVLTVHPCLPTCFHTRMRRSLYKVSSTQARNTLHTIQFHLQIYSWCIVSEKHKICRVFGIHLSRILEIKETTETAASFSYLDCLYIDNGKLTIRLYDKRDDFNFPIVNFPFMSSNIPTAPT